MRAMSRNLHRLTRPRALALAAAAVVAMPAHAIDFFWTSGDFVTGVTAPEPLLAGDTLFIQAGGLKRFVGASLTNQGLVRWQADTLQGGNGTTVANSGVWQSESDTNTLVWAFGGQPVFNNLGTFRKTAGVDTQVGSWRFVSNGGLIDAQVGRISFNGSSNSFNAGSRFTGAGEVAITGTAVFTGAFMSDNLVLAAGTANGSGAVLNGGVAQANGNIGWTGGDLTGSWTIAAGSTLTGSGAGAKRQVGSNIVNQGTLRWSSTEQLQSGNGSSLTNQGLVEATESATFNWNYGGQGSLVNQAGGTVRATNGATLTIGNIALVSNGGLFQTTGGGTIVYAGGTNRFNDGTTFAGDHRLTGASTFVGGIFSDDLRVVAGANTGGDGSPGSNATLKGATRFQGGDLYGHWVIDSGAVVTGESGGAKRQIGSTITNQGTLRWNTGETMQTGNGSRLVNQALMEATTDTSFSWIYGGQGAIVNEASGTMRATNGATLNIGNVALTSNGGRFETTSGGTVVYSGNSNQFNDGTRFVGDHRMTGQSTFFDGIHSDNLQFVSGTLFGGDGNPGSGATLKGAVRWQGGDLHRSWVIDTGAVVTAEDSGAKRQIGSNIVNKGTLRWTSADTMQTGNGSSLNNQALIEATASASFNWIYGGQGAIVNQATGTVRATNGATLNIGNLALTSNGGRFEATAGAGIVYSGSSNRFNDGTRFVGNNAVTGEARYVDTVQSDGLRWVGGTQYGGDGTPGSYGRMAGGVTWEGGDLRDRFEVKAGATLVAIGAGSKRTIGGELVNNGLVRWDSDVSLQGGNGSVLVNNGRFEISTDAGIVWGFGGQSQVQNNGLLVKTGGAGVSSIVNVDLSSSGTIDVRSGAIALPTNFSNAGTLMGTGAFNLAGTLTNNGHLAPGGSAGTLTINGNLLQS
ncbi:MAG: beta strand repeat-containing protein, partial [Aquabacterium sp.]